MWNDRWEPNKYPDPEYGPKRWWRSDHTSGYSIGEVDAGCYMACAPDGNGLMDEYGGYVSFPTQQAAKAYVEAVIANSK